MNIRQSFLHRLFLLLFFFTSCDFPLCSEMMAMAKFNCKVDEFYNIVELRCVKCSRYCLPEHLHDNAYRRNCQYHCPKYLKKLMKSTEGNPEDSGTVDEQIPMEAEDDEDGSSSATQRSSGEGPCSSVPTAATDCRGAPRTPDQSVVPDTNMAAGTNVTPASRLLPGTSETPYASAAAGSSYAEGSLEPNTHSLDSFDDQTEYNLEAKLLGNDDVDQNDNVADRTSN